LDDLEIADGFDSVEEVIGNNTIPSGMSEVDIDSVKVN
jgi:hypothetical protein